jgi:hypothetical protein
VHEIHVGCDVGLLPDKVLDLEPRHALQDHAEVVLGELDHLQDARRAAHGIHVLGHRIVHPGLPLGQNADDGPLLGDGLLHKAYGLPSSHVDGDDRSGKEHGVPQGQNGDLVGKLLYELDILWI